MEQAEAAMDLLVEVTGVIDYELIFLLEERYKRVFELIAVGVYYYQQDFLASGFNWENLFGYFSVGVVGWREIDRISDDNYEIWQNRCKEIYEARSKLNVWTGGKIDEKNTGYWGRWIYRKSFDRVVDGARV